VPGGVWFAVEVVMVIMTFDGFPAYIPRSLSTGEIFLFDVLMSTEINQTFMYNSM